MADSLSKAERSALMGRIRSKNTAPELMVRSCVHGLGYRFRLHDRKLPGSPDLVLRGMRTVVFVHGCFWHRHEGCRNCSTPKTRPAFWKAKFEANCKRDARNRARLSRDGWRVIVVWECETSEPVKLASRLKRLLAAAGARSGRIAR